MTNSNYISSMTIKERYHSLGVEDPGSELTDFDALRQWCSRRCALQQSDWDCLFQLNHYDAKRYSACISDQFEHLVNVTSVDWEGDLKCILAKNTMVDAPYDEHLGYLNAFAPFLVYVRTQVSKALLTDAITCCNESELLAQIMTAYGHRALSIGLKVLVLKMHEERESGCLSGSDPEQRWCTFCQMCADTEYRAKLYARYPVLTRFLTESANDFIDFISEFMQRLSESAQEVALMLGVEQPLRLENIQLDGGDSHAHGRTVIIFACNGRKAVYKPRNLAVHQLFNNIAQACTSAPGFLPLHTTQVIVRREYAFEEFVEHIDCASEDSVERYYRRYGQILGLIWLLGGNDMHYENIISSGEYPQIVDYETVVTGLLDLEESQNGADTLVRRELADSLLSTALLPFRMPLDTQGHTVEISALESSPQTILSAVPVPVQLQTDQARYEIQEIHLEKESSCVKLHGQKIDPYRYANQILAGFDVAVQAIQSLGRIRIEKMLNSQNVRVRVLLRATSVYGRFLGFIRHPSTLTDMRKVESILENLYAFPFSDKHLCVSEYHQLLNGDIPLFTTALDSCVALDCEGHSVGKAFAQSPKDRILQHLDDMSSQVDLQRRIICNALHMPVPRSRKISMRNPDKDSDALLRFVESVADGLIRDSVVDESSGTVSWVACRAMSLSNAQDAHRPSCLPSVPSKDLYEGMAGVGLLFWELFRCSHDARYERFARLCCSQ